MASESSTILSSEQYKNGGKKDKAVKFSVFATSVFAFFAQKSRDSSTTVRLLHKLLKLRTSYVLYVLIVKFGRNSQLTVNNETQTQASTMFCHERATQLLYEERNARDITNE